VLSNAAPQGTLPQLPLAFLPPNTSPNAPTSFTDTALYSARHLRRLRHTDALSTTGATPTCRGIIYCINPGPSACATPPLP